MSVYCTWAVIVYSFQKKRNNKTIFEIRLYIKYVIFIFLIIRYLNTWQTCNFANDSIYSLCLSRAIWSLFIHTPACSFKLWYLSVAVVSWSWLWCKSVAGTSWSDWRIWVWYCVNPCSYFYSISNQIKSYLSKKYTHIITLNLIVNLLEEKKIISHINKHFNLFLFIYFRIYNRHKVHKNDTHNIKIKLWYVMYVNIQLSMESTSQWIGL